MSTDEDDETVVELEVATVAAKLGDAAPRATTANRAIAGRIRISRPFIVNIDATSLLRVF